MLTCRFRTLLPLASGLALLVIAVGVVGGRVATADTYRCDVDASQMAPDAEEPAPIALINDYRASYDLPPLALSNALTQNALWKSSDMATRGDKAHDDSFRPWLERFADCGYDTTTNYVGENLTGGTLIGTATAAFEDWKISPMHNANLLDPHFTVAGIKHRFSPNPDDPNGWYWALELGSTVDSDLMVGLSGN